MMAGVGDTALASVSVIVGPLAKYATSPGLSFLTWKLKGLDLILIAPPLCDCVLRNLE